MTKHSSALFTRNSTSGAVAFELLRFAPLGTVLLIGALTQHELPREHQELIVHRLVALSALFLTWSMAEGVVMLWYRAKVSGVPTSRGYAFVGFGLGFILLLLLSAYRARVDQVVFILTLGMLSLRGMARTSWEQGRCAVGFATSVVGLALLALVSLFTASPDWHWQKGVTALAIGASVASVEVAWFATPSFVAQAARWLLPAFRVLVFSGPVLIATLALLGALPRQAVSVYLAVPLLAWLIRQTSKGGTGNGADLTKLFRATAGVCAGFLAIIAVCCM
jgi:hypothetical protein